MAMPMAPAVECRRLCGQASWSTRAVPIDPQAGSQQGGQGVGLHSAWPGMAWRASRGRRAGQGRAAGEVGVGAHSANRLGGHGRA